MPLPPLDQVPEALVAAARRAAEVSDAATPVVTWWDTFFKWTVGGGFVAFLMKLTQLRSERAQASQIEAGAEDQRVVTAGKVAGYYRDLLNEIEKMRAADAERYEKRIAEDRARFDEMMAAEKAECHDRISVLQAELAETREHGRVLRQELTEMNEKGRALERRVVELELEARGTSVKGDLKGREEEV